MDWQIKVPVIHHEEDVSEEIEYIRGAVEHAKKKGLKLGQIYENPRGCEDGLVQQEIRLATRSLMHRFVAMDAWNVSGVQQRDVESALETLSEARTQFGNHPFTHVLYGRMVFVATEANKAGMPVPQKYKGFVNAKLETWQKPSWNYSSPSDFKNKKDIEEGLPPEWRK